MRGSFSAHPEPRFLLFIVIAFVATTAAIPLARRNDWIGWIALLWIAALAIALWAMLVIGIARAVIAWFRDKPSNADGSEDGLCYDDSDHKLTWDRERLYLETSAGKPIDDIPLFSLLDVIDVDLLFVEGEVLISMPKQSVRLPRSRSGRATIVRLIRNLAQSDTHVHQQLEGQRNRLVRQGVTWLPVSLTLAGAVVAFAVTMPNPKHLNLIWGLLGVAYGLASGWVLWRLAYSMAWLVAARKLHSLLSSARLDDGVGKRGGGKPDTTDFGEAAKQ
jgi:hypothetical protein